MDHVSKAQLTVSVHVIVLSVYIRITLPGEKHVEASDRWLEARRCNVLMWKDVKSVATCTLLFVPTLHDAPREPGVLHGVSRGCVVPAAPPARLPLVAWANMLGFHSAPAEQ